MKVEKEEIFITTFDNPFNPFEEFDEWYKFDSDKKYFTCSYIERIVNANNPNKLSTRATEEEYDSAMKDIVATNPKLYRIVRHKIETDTIYDLI